MASPDLPGNGEKATGDLGSFRIAGDYKTNFTDEVTDFKNHLNISKSFDSKNLDCICTSGNSSSGA
jgi:hypothetical protein